MLDTLPRSAGRLQTLPGGGALGGGPAEMAPRPPDPAHIADAVARYRAYQALREFRGRLMGA